jgi:hypothetical protein
MARNAKSRKLRNKKMRGGKGWFCGTQSAWGCTDEENALARANKSGATQESENVATASSQGAAHRLPPMTNANLEVAAKNAGIGTRINADGGGKFRGGKSNRRRNKKSKKSRRTRRR